MQVFKAEGKSDVVADDAIKCFKWCTLFLDGEIAQEDLTKRFLELPKSTQSVVSLWLEFAQTQNWRYCSSSKAEEMEKSIAEALVPGSKGKLLCIVDCGVSPALACAHRC